MRPISQEIPHRVHDNVIFPVDIPPLEGLYLEIDIQPFLSEVHRLQELFILAGSLDALLLHHGVHLLLVLISDGLEPVQGVELQVLVQQLQNVRHTCDAESENGV